MIKRILALITVVVLCLSLAACIKTRIVHCDYCNAEITVKEDNNMTEEWIIYCETCNEELFEDPLFGMGE